jgi:hypothetical protein
MFALSGRDVDRESLEGHLISFGKKILSRHRGLAVC